MKTSSLKVPKLWEKAETQTLRLHKTLHLKIILTSLPSDSLERAKLRIHLFEVIIIPPNIQQYDIWSIYTNQFKSLLQSANDRLMKIKQ